MSDNEDERDDGPAEALDSGDQLAASEEEEAASEAGAEEEEEEEEEGYAFECPRCGEDASVSFEPKHPDSLLCQTCFEEVGDETFDLSRVPTAPRRKHGTQVVFTITCAECGTEEQLDYVPRGVPMDEMLCTACMAEEYGEDSRWALIMEQKAQEKRKPRKEYEITCADCGDTDYVPFPPKEDRDYLCGKCMLDDEKPDPERLRGKHDLGDNVFIRKKD